MEVRDGYVDTVDKGLDYVGGPAEMPQGGQNGQPVHSKGDEKGIITIYVGQTAIFNGPPTVFDVGFPYTPFAGRMLPVLNPFEFALQTILSAAALEAG